MADAAGDHQLKRFRAEVFGRGAADYDQVSDPIMARLGERLVELAEIGDGDAVLDVATGRGAVLIPAAARVGPEGRVVGIDLAEQMVELTSREIAAGGLANAEVRIGDAESLDGVADAEFDCVTCAFAIFFLPDPARALREFARVLRPGGTVALSSWGPGDARYDWYPQLREELGIERVNIETQSFEAPGELSQGLENAGFTDVEVSSEPVVFRLESPEEWWRWLHTTASRATIDSLAPEDLDRFRAAAFERIREVYPDGVVELEEEALFGVARRR